MSLEEGRARQGKKPGSRSDRPTGQGGGRDRQKEAATEAHEGPRQRRPYRESRAFSRGVYSAIDLGTNNCRLLIARPTRQGFRVIDAFSRIVRLGEGVSANNRLSDEAMDRAVEALKVCAEKIQRRGVTCMRHVATEACRVADNAPEFLTRVKEETGLNLDIISAREEARLAVMGCQSLIAPGNKHALVFDIGGGSTELIWVRVLSGRRTEISGWMSIPWGVVNLSERFAVPGITPPPEQYTSMVEEVASHLRAFEDAHQVGSVIKKRHTQFLGTSGTVTTLASLHLNLPRYQRDKVDGAWMKSRDIYSLSQRVAQMTHAERAAQPCIGEERADLVVVGCAILEAILGMWNVPSLRVADRGIREGILRGLMQTEHEPRTGDGRNRQRAG
ncbi:Ppx/GppA phosphatase family protein [Kordiimonas marina]|uniref:Ppx/GppA phosphatase family protein n=1 Tax=Kordiimonas marina TaxID=2872312 RepID=UPI001FF0E1F6|nr:Ppx/GppA phosphatase family protein [Kordiimonas marina]MCJ9429007.1 Ppx/GppA family phosphatase [Kordiimonas marina]